jgi:hypothetical protein
LREIERRSQPGRWQPRRGEWVRRREGSRRLVRLRQAELAFACADPRLLQVGTRWIGVVVGTTLLQPSSSASLLDQGRLWLAPGLLLPYRIDVKRALRLVPNAVPN